MDWKDTLKALQDSGTLPEGDKATAPDTSLPASITSQHLRLHIRIEKKGRHGKCATIISGIPDSETAGSLTRYLKQRLGTGGSYRDDEILIQGNCRDKCIQLLKDKGWQAR